jgi:hypothetical protein
MENQLIAYQAEASVCPDSDNEQYKEMGMTKVQAETRETVGSV